MSDKVVMEYVEEERSRCVALCELFDGADTPFLIYCLNSSIYPNEDMAAHRKRFEEFGTEPDEVKAEPEAPVDDLEDLM